MDKGYNKSNMQNNGNLTVYIQNFVTGARKKQRTRSYQGALYSCFSTYILLKWMVKIRLFNTIYNGKKTTVSTMGMYHQAFNLEESSPYQSRSSFLLQQGWDMKS